MAGAFACRLSPWSRWSSMGYYDNGRPIVTAPEGEEDLELWDLLEMGGERVPLLNEAEARAAMLLLQILSSGDGLGHEQAHALAGRLARRIPEPRERLRAMDEVVLPGGEYH